MFLRRRRITHNVKIAFSPRGAHRLRSSNYINYLTSWPWEGCFLAPNFLFPFYEMVRLNWKTCHIPATLSSYLILFSSRKGNFLFFSLPISSYWTYTLLLFSSPTLFLPLPNLKVHQIYLSQTAACLFSLLKKKTFKKLSRRTRTQEYSVPGEEGRGPSVSGGGGGHCLELRLVRKQEAIFILPLLAGWLSILLGSSALCLKYRPPEELSLVVQPEG